MKKLICFFFVVGSLFQFSACVSIKEEIFLQNMNIEGSPSQPPVHITSADRKENSLYASPHLSFGSGTLKASLEQQYEGRIPDSLGEFRAKGLSWKLPRVAFGIDLDYAATNSFALNGGIAAAIGKGQQLTSLYGGIGLFSPDSSAGVRFDIGVQYIDIRYRGATVVFRSINGGPQDTVYYLDRGKDFQLNLFANLTINSTNPDGLNWFLQLGISPQTLTDFVPRKDASDRSVPYSTDLRAEINTFWISATPGLYFTLSQNRRLVIGVRLMKELASESSTPGLIFIPTVQFDWKL